MNQIVDVLINARHVLITTHINPDGDAIGSSLGLYHWLQSHGISAIVMSPNALPANLQWLPGADKVLVWEQASESLIHDADVIVVLDLNALSRLGKLGESIRSASSCIINIDHHTHPEDFASIAWIDTEACSTSSMIASLITTAPATLSSYSAQTATCLYTGIMTDTGSFRFPRTTADVFTTVAELVRNGADPVLSYERVMNQGNVGRAKLLGKTLSTMDVRADGRLCVMVVSQADIQDYQCSLEDIEGFVQHTLTLRGVEMGILLVELPDEIKCSFRSKGTAYVRDLAASFGGGGHIYAAGARVRESSLQTVANEIASKAIATLQTPR